MNADNRTYDTPLSNTTACWIPPEREGEYHSSLITTAYRDPMAGWEPLYRVSTTPPAPQQLAAAEGLQHKINLLADALGACILASGIVRKDVDGFTGPQLLLFAEDLRCLSPRPRRGLRWMRPAGTGWLSILLGRAPTSMTKSWQAKPSMI